MPQQITSGDRRATWEATAACPRANVGYALELVRIDLQVLRIIPAPPRGSDRRLTVWSDAKAITVSARARIVTSPEAAASEKESRASKYRSAATSTESSCCGIGS